jgi:hypothetical protein
MTGGYQLTPADLYAHAKEVARFADSVREAKASASDPMAHGVLGYAWGLAMKAWCDDAHDFVDSAAAKADDVARELGGMAASYESAEQTAVDNLRQAGGDAP